MTVVTVYSFTIVPSASAVALVRLTGYRTRGPLCTLAASLGYPEPDPNTLTSQLHAYGHMLAVESTADGPYTETATYGAWRGLVAAHVHGQLQVTAANARAARAARRQGPEGVPPIPLHTDPTPSTPQLVTAVALVPMVTTPFVPGPRAGSTGSACERAGASAGVV